jgi:hypothetical protein
MNLGRANKAYVFFLTALGAWIYAVIADSPPDEIVVSNTEWAQLIVGVIFATLIGYLTKNNDPAPAPEPDPPPAAELLVYQPPAGP